jgi:hypothetical protein
MVVRFSNVRFTDGTMTVNRTFLDFRPYGHERTFRSE